MRERVRRESDCPDEFSGDVPFERRLPEGEADEAEDHSGAFRHRGDYFPDDLIFSERLLEKIEAVHYEFWNDSWNIAVKSEGIVDNGL